MNDGEKLSVIILIHNNVGISMTCLDSLVDAVSELDHEIIVLDNHSSEDTRILRQYGKFFRSFKWIQNDQNASFSIGNNLCARESSGRLFLFLNNDVFLKKYSIHQMIGPLLENPKIGATGGKLLFPGEKSVQNAGIRQMLWEHPSNYGVGALPSDARIQDKCERFAVSGAMLCTTREVFEGVGGFDERYIWGTEDIDLCLKIRAAGWKTVYCPEAEAVHCESATLKTTKSTASSANCSLFRKKWDPLLVPVEQEYVRTLKDSGIRRVAIFGMGTAALGMAKILNANGIGIAAFTSSAVKNSDGFFLDRPILPLDHLYKKSYDRLMVATQYFFEVESGIRDYDPDHSPIYPVLN
ncbi:MAG: glycosyltransferase family 2 protein [Acidobacteria bacterium]|nr:glycosyltransferase family 2 protein [Acidobacteriota bacterium]